MSAELGCVARCCCIEFGPACWAVWRAHGLCSMQYLFSGLFVFPGAVLLTALLPLCACCLCALFVLVVARRSVSGLKHLHRLALLSALYSLSSRFLSFLFVC